MSAGVCQATARAHVHARRPQVTTERDIVGCMTETLRPHFHAVCAVTTPEQKQALKANMEIEMKKAAAKNGGQGQTEVNDQMLEMMSSSTMVDVVPLIPAIPAGGYMAVSLYVDDKGSVKNLPVNDRASGLVAASGGNVIVMGDAFVARAYDNEAEDMARHPFTLAEVDADAAWLKEAWRIKRVLEQTRQGVPQDKAAAAVSAESAVLHSDSANDGHSFVPQIYPQMTAQQRLDAAEAIRTAGNAAFKQENFAGALAAYSKALRYLEVNPPLEGQGSQAPRVSALLNTSMCWLKLSNFLLCLESCNAVLKLDAKNTKALFRKGLAHKGLAQWEESVKALRAASETAPGDAAVTAELSKAEKALKKHVYGW